MAGMITRCPKCATAFRISDAHLKSAKGMVRCGNCLEVFNAAQHIQQKSRPAATPASSAPAQPAPAAATLIKPAPPVADEPKATQPAAPAEPAAPAPPNKPKASSPTTGKLFDTPPARPATPPAEPQPAPDEDDEDDDEAWALELLKDDSDLNIQLKKIVEPEPEPVPESEPAPEAAIEALAAPADTKPANVHDMLSAIEPDALEVSWEDEQTGKRRRRLWLALVCIAALALFAQVAWLQFHRLGVVEPYRTFYTHACNLIGCTLPEQKNLAAITTSKLIVRTHPDQRDALLVDVILQNNATFEQRFPGLVLTFSNLQNQPVAARRFGPEEYLGGELAGFTHMPVNQPVHIAIEIADPGPDALSYSVAVTD